MSIQEFLRNLTNAFELQPLETISWSIILALIVWLYKEFRRQYQTNKQLKMAKTESLASNISKALSVAHNYKTDSSYNKEFFVAVYSCFPYWDFKSIKEIREIMDDVLIEEKEKVEKISRELYNQLERISIQNRELSDMGSGYQALEYGMIRLKDIFYPIVQAIATFLLMASIFITSFGIDNKVIGTIKLMSILFLLMLPFALFDLYKGQRLEKSGKIFSVVILSALLLSILFTDGSFVYTLFIIFVLFFIFLIKWGIKGETS